MEVLVLAPRGYIPPLPRRAPAGPWFSDEARGAGHVKQSLELLSPYLTSAAGGLSSPYEEGGALYAQAPPPMVSCPECPSGAAKGGVFLRGGAKRG